MQFGTISLAVELSHAICLSGNFDAARDEYTYDINEADEESFTTDFLTDEAINSIRNRNPAHPFCMVLSIPDPHGPNTVS